ncbi:MAG TPA: hypothetical protein DEB17_09085 [Chlorobaculum sp.]|uniref:Uncharacterized protein n=1 Tax=Chlorobaculum tepidum (strain ATCC 49652 / DSM 12025 / NBRC 103806 / TLS) TaxID=194439 RepID=Q8KE18_CHLTE|nr:hypothetical protein CT0875 [Chlorobaculum tepidum TLS]HBU24121.1 hypothetical protein [Chlorobaculum sp.]
MHLVVRYSVDQGRKHLFDLRRSVDHIGQCFVIDPVLRDFRSYRNNSEGRFLITLYVLENRCETARRVTALRRGTNEVLPKKTSSKISIFFPENDQIIAGFTLKSLFNGSF